eukprot:5647_1
MFALLDEGINALEATNTFFGVSIVKHIQNKIWSDKWIREIIGEITDKERQREALRITTDVPIQRRYQQQRSNTTKLEKEIQRVNDDLQQLVDKIETHANDKERYKNLIEKNRLREQLDQYQTRIIDLGDDINRRERENKKKVSEFLNKHNRGNRTNHRVLCTPNLQYYIAINTTALRSQFDFEMIDNEKINGMNAKTQLLLSSVQELHKIVA